MLERLELDSAGIREFLQSDDVRTLIDATAEQVAGHVKAALPEQAPVEVRPYTTDRDAASVVIADKRAAGWQARDGILTRAAGAAGLEVKRRS